jgi:membrane protein YqaA with SNARE-associated domain
VSVPDKESKSIKMHLFNTSIFNKHGNLDWHQMIGKTILLIGFFLIVYSIGLFFVRDSYNLIGDWVISNLGYVGIALFVFLTDMLIVPMSVDILYPFVLRWDPVKLILTMSVASVLGGYAGYWIGRLLGRLPIIRRFTESFSADGSKLIHKYGVWAVAIAGFTPIPFSTICWMTGMLKVTHWQVALAALSRFPRIIIYYLIFRGGLSFMF